MKHSKILVFAVFVITLFSCDHATDQPESIQSQTPLFTHLSSDQTGFDFINEVENGKEINIFKYRNFYNGGGVALGDINNDGLADIYMSANMGSNKLYLNKGDFKFEDITETAGVKGTKPWSTGVTMVDINQDGFLDIYVGNAGDLFRKDDDNELFINNGDLTFSEKATDYNLAKSGFTTHASFFDYDKDGDLDVYILNNSNIPVSTLNHASDRDLRAEDWKVNESFKGVGDLLLRNDDGKFVDVSEEAGIYGSIMGFGLGVYVTDLNNDLYPDIYVSNDFYERDYLYINNQDGTFREDIKNWTSHLCLSAMGVDMADVNNDGLNDIFITDMLPEAEQRIKSVMEFEGYNIFQLKQSRDFYQQYIQNTLQINNGNGTFSETAYFSGIAKTDWSWAGLLFDMDNDGLKDLYITNGINHDLTDIDFVDFFANEVVQKLVVTGKKEEITSIIDKMPVVKLPNYAYRNNGDLTFDNVTEDWGLKIPSFSNGCAYADLDNDGDLDVVVNNVNMESFLFRNESDQLTDNNYIKFKLNGTDRNRDAIGASMKLYIGDKILFQEVVPSRGFQSSVEYVSTIGLGKAKSIDSVHVLWPDDKIQRLFNLQSNQLIELNHVDAVEVYRPLKKDIQKTLLVEVPNESLDFHVENYFNDYDFEGLISKKLSQEGPALAVGDVNGDGHDDVYVGGAKGQAGGLYLHNGSGRLERSKQKTFEMDAAFEEVAAVFFDIDGDGDNDLAVGSGGNEKEDKKYYTTRIYLNDGQGKFSRSLSDLPTTNNNISVLAPNDFNDDGNIDLFVGSRSVPGVYGIDPKHLLLKNNGDGTFTDITERSAFQIKDAGMITDAIWIDLDADSKKDLVTVAEWGSPMAFKNSGRRLSKMDWSLDSLNGWWNAVQASDLDGDGDMDLVLGNRGGNVPYKSSRENPMKLWINDFDNNGTIEQIMTTHYDGGDYPLHMRKELTMQLVSLKKENLKASEYAKKSIDQLFSKEVINTTIVKTGEVSESVVAINEGGGKFTIKELPSRVQLSCVCGISCSDVNNDGNMDIILAGNNYEYKPQFSRLDANFGSVLLGDGAMNFEWQNYSESGFFVRDEVKHLDIFSDKDGNEYIFTAINDQKPRVFGISK